METALPVYWGFTEEGHAYLRSEASARVVLMTPAGILLGEVVDCGDDECMGIHIDSVGYVSDPAHGVAWLDGTDLGAGCVQKIN